ncbi:MAG: HD domain-containing protein [Treponema sp.]|nr:HD domain-containing protein [Treponema sp.]
MLQTPEAEVSAAGFPVYLHGFSAIDSYLGRKTSNAVYLLCGADLADLARLFEGLRYPGAVLADAALDLGAKTWYFRCEDDADALYRHRASFGFLEFFQDCKTRRFHDPNGIYPILREIANGNQSAGEILQSPDPYADPCRAIIDCALILARYFPETTTREINAALRRLNGRFALGTPPEKEEQRLLLTELLNAPCPTNGFEFLKSSGFIAAYWPELAVMDDVDHSKEFHPEGNVWKHTMETLRYRKPDGGGGFDLRLSLGLLLHDVGKPISQSASRKRFDGHAELGEAQARRFLERLGFQAPLIRDVCYLVRNHMLPAALPRLPLFRTGEKMASPLFPLLMELYRCDESSSFKGLDGYYQSSAAYRSYLKHRRNPYRSEDGKKLGQS